MACSAFLKRQNNLKGGYDTSFHLNAANNEEINKKLSITEKIKNFSW